MNNVQANNGNRISCIGKDDSNSINYKFIFEPVFTHFPKPDFHHPYSKTTMQMQVTVEQYSQTAVQPISSLPTVHSHQTMPLEVRKNVTEEQYVLRLILM